MENVILRFLGNGARVRAACALLISALLALSLSGCTQTTQSTQATTTSTTEATQSSSTSASTQAGVSLDDIPAWSGSPYVTINNNTPNFSASDLAQPAGTETYSALDSLGRAGAAFGILGSESMPAQGETRGSISEIKPAGWVNNQYDIIGEGTEGSLYNRCHLLAWMLSAENANERNLITGTRYMNTEGMLPFETQVATYIRQTGNHVAMRVTPIYDGSNLVASGVQMEAQSVEDGGTGCQFNVYCYNVQDGITIDYATGENHLTASDNSEGTSTESTSTNDANANTSATSEAETQQTYVLNTNTGKFHLPTCDSVSAMKDKNKREVTTTRQDLINQNYQPCGACNP